MPEGLELPESHSKHGEFRYTVPVSVTMAILAVFVAVATLLSHRAHTEELLLQSHATDQWAYYQAKNIRLHEVQAAADLLGALAPSDKQKTGALREKYLKEAERYSSEKDDISDKAKEYENERDLLSRRADRFDGGEALLEVGLVICSVTLLTRRRAFWFSGMLIGAAGVIVALTGALLR